MAFEKDSNQNFMDLTPPKVTYQNTCPLIFDIDTVSDNQLLLWLNSFSESEYLNDKINSDLDYWTKELQKVLD